jgi:hypothetical protein
MDRRFYAKSFGKWVFLYLYQEDSKEINLNGALKTCCSKLVTDRVAGISQYDADGRSSFSKIRKIYICGYLVRTISKEN